MPPYQNESLHDMHALMQQLDTLNAGHAPEYLEMPWSKKPPDNGAATPAPVDPNASTSTMTKIKGALFGGKKTEPSAKDTLFTSLEPYQKEIVFDNTFKDIMTILKAPHSNASSEKADLEALKTALQSFPKTKTLIEANITPNPVAKV